MDACGESLRFAPVGPDDGHDLAALLGVDSVTIDEAKVDGYAMLGDIHLAEPGALIGFAGPRVIEQTIRETLPPGFQRSEYLVEKGMVDRVAHRKDLPQVLGSILGTLMMGRNRKAA